MNKRVKNNQCNKCRNKQAILIMDILIGGGAYYLCKKHYLQKLQLMPDNGLYKKYNKRVIVKK